MAFKRPLEILMLSPNLERVASPMPDTAATATHKMSREVPRKSQDVDANEVDQ